MINCSLFHELENLKMLHDLKENNIYENILRAKIDEIFETEGTITYLKLLRELYGVFPTELFKYLSDDYINRIHFDESDKEHDNDVQCSIVKRQKLLPQEHLANFEWRFSGRTIQWILSNLHSDNNVCCLGTPSIANNIVVGEQCKNATFLDINTPIISLIKDNNMGICAQSYNVLYDLNKELEHSFDCVITNPPWYLDYYKLFIKRSLQLLKREGGNIIIPIFSILSRHHAISDLIELFEYIFSLGCLEIKTLGVIEFEMPLFEKNVFLNCNTPIPNNCWRTSELVQLTFGSFDTTLESKNSYEINDFVEWDRMNSADGNNYYVLNTRCIQNLKNDNQFELKQLRDISRNEIGQNIKKIIFWNNNNQIIVKT